MSRSVCRFLKEELLGTPAVPFRDFFHQLNPCGLLQPEVVGTYLPGTGTLGYGAWCAAGTPCCKISFSNFYPPHVDVGPACSASLPLPQSG